MKGNIFSPESILSNAIAVLLLVLAVKRPATARMFLSILFIGAALFNGYSAIVQPEKYLAFADLAALPIYETFIRGNFSHYITAYILVIALAQLITGICIASRRAVARTALAGAAMFLVAIAPLGAGSAFPCSIILAAACIILFIKGQPETLAAIYGKKPQNRRSLM